MSAPTSPSHSEAPTGISCGDRQDVYEAGRRWRREIERGLSGKRRVELDAETAKAESEIDEAVRDHTARIRVDVGEASVSNVRASSAAAVVAAPLS